MPREREYTLVQIRQSGRDMLRTLAWYRRKHMYEVLEDILREALEHDGMLSKDEEGSYATTVAASRND